MSHTVATLVIGDPSGGDESDWGRHGNNRLDDWADKRTMNLLEYKAREQGIEVERRDERGTSSQCSAGFEDGESRLERGLWNCDRYGVVAHGDGNGADNISQQTLPVTPPLGAEDSGPGCVAQPRISQFDRTQRFQPRDPVDGAKPSYPNPAVAVPWDSPAYAGGGGQPTRRCNLSDEGDPQLL